MTIARRHLFRFAAVALSLPAWPAWADDGLRSGKVFTIGNAAAGNEVLVYEHAPGGALRLLRGVPTGGLGSGSGLGSQGAVALSGDGRYLFVVNAASHTVSTFALRFDSIELRSVVASGGLGPISVSERGGLVFVLNAEGAGNVAGFHNVGGELKPIAGTVRPLSAAGGTAPAQLGLDRESEVLVVAERATNRLTTYRVGAGGGLGMPTPHASAGLTPFGFEFGKHNVLLVSEAFGGAPGASALSSYRLHGSTPLVVSASVATTQTAACWVAITPDGRYAYVTNTGSGTVSSYGVGAAGELSLLEAVAADTGAGSAPLDAAIAGRRLHVLNGGSRTIASYRIARDGTLAPLGSVGGLPIGATGLAAN